MPRSSVARICTQLVIAAILCGRAVAPALAVDTSIEVVEKIKKQIVLVQSDRGGGHGVLGTGFFVGNDRTVVTNVHVIANARRIVVTTRSGQQIPAEVILANPGRDLAVLQLAQGTGATPFRLVPAEHVRNEDVWAAGYTGVVLMLQDQRDRVSEATVSKGTISNRNVVIPRGGLGGGTHAYTHTAFISHGNSGGPLVNACGDVVGIVQGGLDQFENDTAQLPVNRNGDAVPVPQFTKVVWAIQAEELIPLLDSLAAKGFKFEKVDAVCDPQASARHEIDGAIAKDRDERKDHETKLLIAVVAAIVLALGAGALALTRTGRRAVTEAKRKLTTMGRPRVPSSSPSAPPVAATVAATLHVPAATKAVRALLIGVSGEFTGVEIELGSAPIVLGRSPHQANLVFTVDAGDIGREHCSVRFDTSRMQFVLRDLNSSNGTFVASGRRMARGGEESVGNGTRFYLASPKHSFELRVY